MFCRLLQSPQSQSQQVNATADLDEGNCAVPQEPRPEMLDRIAEDEEIPSTVDDMKIDGSSDDRHGEEPPPAQAGDVQDIAGNALDQAIGQREQDPAAVSAGAAAAAVPTADEPRREGKAVCKEAGGVGEGPASEEKFGEKHAQSSPTGDEPLASESPHRKKQRRSDAGSTDHVGGNTRKRRAPLRLHPGRIAVSRRRNRQRRLLELAPLLRDPCHRRQRWAMTSRRQRC